MHLHQLIQSLSTSEKRYFNTYAKMGKRKPPKYLGLFDLINKKPNTDEENIRKKGYNADNQSFLTDKILDSLQVSYARKEPPLELNWLLGQLPHLWERKLLGELKKRLRQIHKLADQLEDFNALLQVIRWQKRLVKEEGGKAVIGLYKKWIEREKEVKAQLENQLDYENLKEQLNLIRAKDIRLQKEENRQAFQELLDTPLLAATPTLLSNGAKANYYYIQCLNYRYQKNPPKAFDYVCQLVDLFENNKTFRSQNSHWYQQVLCLKIEMAYANSQLSIIPPLVNLIRSINATKNEDKKDQKLLCNVYSYGMLHALGTVNWEKGIVLIQELEQQWDNLVSFMPERRQLAFYYNIMVFYCFFEKWSEAETWLIRILNFQRIPERKDIQNAARLWRLIIDYEQNNDLDNAIKTAYKYLKHHQHFFDFESKMIQYFRQLLKAYEPIKAKAIFQNMEKDFGELWDVQRSGTQQLGLQEVYFWTQGKIMGKNIGEIISGRSFCGI